MLVEGNERGRWMGRTRTNKIVFFDATDNIQSEDRTGQLVMVCIDEVGPWSMQGHLTRVVHEAPQALVEARKAHKRRFRSAVDGHLHANPRHKQY